MNNFEFVDHFNTPQDQYVKEVVILQFNIQLANGKITPMNHVFFRKSLPDGRLFWDLSPKTGVVMNGQKEMIKIMSFDSNFFTDDLKTYLDKRSWENVKVNKSPTSVFAQATTPNDDQGVPF